MTFDKESNKFPLNFNILNEIKDKKNNISNCKFNPNKLSDPT